MNDYSYPLDNDWTTEEMLIVVELWAALENAYEGGVETEVFMEKYRDFKTVVKSIGEEKRLGKEFEKVSGYSLYRTLQQAKQQSQKILRMED